MSPTRSFDLSVATPGAHTYTLTVTDSMGKTTKKTRTIHIDNDPPIAHIAAPTPNQVVYKNSLFVVIGSATDQNQIAGIPCNKLAWKSSKVTDEIHGFVGCQKAVHFTTLGARTLTLTASDTAGATGSTHVTISVQDAPLGAPPIVTITSPVGTRPRPTMSIARAPH